MDSLIQLYNKLHNSNNEFVWLQVYLRHWLTSVVEFDPRTFEPMTITLTELSQKSLEVNNDLEIENRDFLYHIAVNLLGNSLNLLLPKLNTKIVRTHEIMPLVNAREFDRACMQWVARKSGRNLKEKLALDNKVLAVRRQQNYNTTENQLLKSILKELQYLFDEKQVTFNLSNKEYEEQELVELIESWLVSEECSQIGSWQNLPPNNTLLQHKYYRKIWYVYQFLQKLDEYLENDKANLKKHTFLVLHFCLIAELMQYNEIRLGQMPIQINYETFKIYSGFRDNYLKGYLIKNNQYNGYFQMTLHENFYHVELINDDEQSQFDVQCLLNENKQESLFQLKFSIKGGEYNCYPIKDMQELIFQIMSGFSHFVGKKQTGKSAKNPDTTIVNIFDNFHSGVGNFIAQIWENLGEEYGENVIYVGDSKALYVRNDIKTYSLYNALKCNKEIQAKIIPVIINGIAHNIDDKKLTFLINDRFGDFDLQQLKQSLNICFGGVNLLPKSIASGFSLLSNKNSIENDDYFLFIDMDNDSISFTKLKTSRDDELFDLGYDNFIFERYPTDVIVFSNYFKEYLINVKKINESASDVIANNFNIKDIRSLNLSLICDDFCYHYEALDIDQNQIKIEKEYLDKIHLYFEEFFQNHRQSKIVLTPDLLYLIPKKYQDKVIELNDLNVGVGFLSEQQNRLGEYANRLWQDHLPYMGIRIKADSGYEKFDLVKNVTVSPKRGQRISIPVNDIFILPKNQNYYKFPLYLGDKNQANMYQATLKSTIFPLKDNAECQVKLYYTYGAEEPYELYFITDKKEKIKAEWKVFDDSDVEYPVPEYPEPLTLGELKCFKTKTGEIINLIDKVNEAFVQLLKDLSNKDREIGIVSNILNGKDFLFIETRDGKDVLLHKNNLMNGIDFNDLELGDELHFELVKNKQGKFSAVGASFSEDYPYDFYIENFLKNHQKKFNWHRFIIYTLFNNAQEFNKSDVGCLYDNFHHVIKQIVKIKENFALKNQSIKEYFDGILYCNYIDIDERFLREILSDLTAKKVKVNKNLAYLLGDLSKCWQCQIYECLTHLLQSKSKSEVYQVFGIAFWRHSELIYKLSDEQVKIIWFGVVDLIEELIQNSNSKKYKFFYELSKYWQLVLALLRLRNRETVKQLFSPSSQVIEKLVYLLSETEKIVDSQETQKQKFKTYVEFSLEKPEYEKSRDFFYAVRLYLTGDDGANAIQVKVGEEN